MFYANETDNTSFANAAEQQSQVHESRLQQEKPVFRSIKIYSCRAPRFSKLMQVLGSIKNAEESGGTTKTRSLSGSKFLLMTP